jgi:arabinofuranosyltransferase
LLLTLLAALLALNRLDVLLLVAPVMALALYESARNETTRPVWLGLVALGSLPLVVWSLFSLLYYGSLISNTAYAKLNTGIPAELLVRQGINYLRSAFHYDPVTPVLIAAGVAAATFSRDRAPALIALGVVLYIVYVVRIGGDFMAGRFLAAPVLCAVMILSHVTKPGRRYPALTVAALALALASPYSPLRSGPDYHNQDQAEIMRFSGVADERGFYYQRMGLFGAERQADFTPGAGCRSDDDRLVVRGHCGGLGFDGFTGCEDAYLVDRCALAEPLLARLPVVDLVNWRIGHFFRRLPAGYVESLETGENAIRDPHLRRLYEDVALVTRGDLLSWLRLRAIYRLHFHDYGI